MSHPIENIMKTSMEQIKEMVDVNTIVGNPILIENVNMVLPVSKVSLGFISGGGEYVGKESAIKKSGEILDGRDGNYPFAGTAVAGISLSPMAFLSMTNGEAKMLPVHYNTTMDRLIEVIPQTVREIIKVFSGKDSCVKVVTPKKEE